MFTPPSPMVTLTALRHYIARHSSLPKVAVLTYPHIDAARLGDLASINPARACEPWLWEAHMLARVLGVDDIATLIGTPIADITTHEAIHRDIDIWRSGVPLPLTTAIRLTKRFGLADPIDLHDIATLRGRNPILRETWETLASGERLAALGGQAGCPWCMQPITAGADHLDTCVPANLWGPRGRDIEGIHPETIRPRSPGKQVLGNSHYAPGLRAVRHKALKTRTQMADTLGISLGHYSKLEGCKAKLPYDLAVKIGHIFSVRPLDLTSPPGPAETVGSSDNEGTDA